MPKKRSNRPCEDCGQPTIHDDDRFCKDCRKARVAQMQADNYLRSVPRHAGRPSEKMQAPDMEPSPWGENAVRALEE